ncbi:unnamed protein product [Mytilus edulis]|uniref:Uncharacterized protein n=1 Tax=Mytilus edulis TaxID=6550 RepID=A0A8S3V5T0_MYTED|nr:unnamed protein product [Mytilus edulis]
MVGDNLIGPNDTLSDNKAGCDHEPIDYYDQSVEMYGKPHNNELNEQDVIKMYEEFNEKEKLRELCKRSPKQFKICTVKLEAAHKARCKNTDHSDSISEIEISGRSKIGRVFNEDEVCVEILKDEIDEYKRNNHIGPRLNVTPDMSKLNLKVYDPSNAKDLDDALSIEELDDTYRVGVHIADVTSYIVKGCDIDIEAVQLPPNEEHVKAWLESHEYYGDLILKLQEIHPSPSIQEGSKNRCSIEIIFKSSADQRIDAVLQCLDKATILAQAIATGTAIPKLDEGHYKLGIDSKPDCRYEGLVGNNTKQRNAIRRALTNSFSLIQGPPGWMKWKLKHNCPSMVRWYGTSIEDDAYPIPGKTQNSRGERSKADEHLREVSMHILIRELTKPYQKEIAALTNISNKIQTELILMMLSSTEA